MKNISQNTYIYFKNKISILYQYLFTKWDLYEILIFQNYYAKKMAHYLVMYFYHLGITATIDITNTLLY